MTRLDDFLIACMLLAIIIAGLVMVFVGCGLPMTVAFATEGFCGWGLVSRSSW